MSSVAFVKCFIITAFIKIFMTENVLSKSVHHVAKRETAVSTEELDKLVKSTLLQMHLTYDLDPLDTMTLSCKTQAMVKALEMFPFAEYRWLHNSKSLKLQPTRMVYKLERLTINNLIPQDSGSYHCVVEIEPNKQFVVAIYSAVIGIQEQSVAKEQILKLDCRSQEFGKLFPKAVRYWIGPNGKRLYEKPASEHVESIPNADERLAGMWTCYTEDVDVPRKWKTARLKIVVGTPQSKFQKTLKLAKAHKPETLAILMSIVFIIFVMCQMLIGLIEKKEKRMKDEVEKIQNVLNFRDEHKSGTDSGSETNNGNEEDDDSESDSSDVETPLVKARKV